MKNEKNYIEFVIIRVIICIICYNMCSLLYKDINKYIFRLDHLVVPIK